MLSDRFGVLAYILAGACLILSGCASREAGVADDDKMEISVDFREIHRCSRISPEITVAYAPKGTKFYDVRLLEKGEPDRFLGGGTWQEDGSGLIPEGALTRHYTGPCPPQDRETEYAYVVSAMASENGQPLEVRLFRFRPE
ncbi:MAG: MbtF [Desulfovibrio sp.]|nr:MbtF [Desulfovibrio sp.]